MFYLRSYTKIEAGTCIGTTPIEQEGRSFNSILVLNRRFDENETSGGNKRSNKILHFCCFNHLNISMIFFSR